MPEGRAIFHAVGAAQNIADRLDETASRPKPDHPADPQQRSRPRRQDFRDGTAERRCNLRRQLREDRRDRLGAAFRLPEDLRQSRGKDEEGKEGKKRKKREVAGMDEPVIIDADRHPLDHLPPMRAMLQLLRDVAAEGSAHARQLLAALLGGKR